jgi:hypothetical protein
MTNAGWTTGQELLKRWNAVDVELLNAFGRGLRPCPSIDDRPSPANMEKQKSDNRRDRLEAGMDYCGAIFEKLKSASFAVADVEKFERDGMQ